MVIVIAIILLLLLIWYFLPSASDRFLGKRVTITTQITPNPSLCSSSSVTATGIVTRVNSDQSVGVTWDMLVANPPYPVNKPDSYKCMWRRSPAESYNLISWNNSWFGTDTFNPTANYGLQSVYSKEQINRLTVL